MPTDEETIRKPINVKETQFKFEKQVKWKPRLRETRPVARVNSEDDLDNNRAKLFNEEFDDSVDSDDPELDTTSRRLHKVFKTT